MFDDKLAVSDIGLSPEEKERARLPEKPENPGSKERCAMCGGPIEPDGFCFEFGPIAERWLCDQHVHEFRATGQHLPLRPPMTRLEIEHAIQVVNYALKNLAMIDKIEARDSSGASRGIEVSMTFKQSRPILKAMLEMLKLKVSAYPETPPPIVEAEPK
jgi:hypothetical protein